MNNINKSVSIIGQLFGLLMGSGFTTPMENTLKKYQDFKFFN